MDKLKPINLIQVTGRVRFKRFNADNNNLFFVVTVSIPKTIQSDDGNNINRDYPAFVVEGEEALKLNDKIQVGNSVTVIGHMDTRMVMRNVDRNLYKRFWQSYLVADHVIVNESRVASNNTATVAGKIIRVYRNADDGKKFYMVTVRIPLENGEITRVTFTLFNRNMDIEPKVDDFAMVTGVVQTHRVEEGNRKGEIITSIVARSAVIEKAEKLEDKENTDIVEEEDEDYII